MSNTDQNSRAMLVRRNLKDSVETHVREAIFAGNMRPGQKIDQDELADIVGVSKLPVREALISLESEGLITNVPRRGAFVTEITPDDIRDHYEIYGRVSGIAAAHAALEMSAANVASLREIHDQFHTAEDPEKMEEVNFQFHRAINAGASRRLRAVIALLNKTLPDHFYEVVSGWQSIARVEHKRILRAIEARDGEAADTAMREHIVSGGDYAIEMLARTGFWHSKRPK